MTDIKHILRYGTNADQDYFTDFDSCYDIVAINASMAAFAPNALAIFVAKKTPEKEFFIDPMTHLFQHNKGYISSEKRVDGEEKVEIKRSIAKLIDKYAEKVDGYNNEDTDKNYNLLREKIRADAIDATFFKQLAEGVLDFQKGLVPDEKKVEYSAYIDYANQSVSEDEKIDFQNTPIFLIAPYFFLQANDEWLNKNISLIEQSISLKGDFEIYSQLVISKHLLDKAVLRGGDSDLDTIVTKYSEQNVSGYLVWVDNYIEHDEPSESLVKYSEILKTLKSGDKKVNALYGGYFSVLLGHKDIAILDGVAHGLEYGEARAVVPVGGGIPRAKFYLPKLHKRVDFPDMVEFLKEKEIDTKEKYHQEICDCSTCREVIRSNDVLTEFTNAFGQTKSTTIKRGDSIVTLSFSTKETKDLSLRHYLASKKIEFGSLENKNIAELIQELKDVSEEYQKYFDASYTAHLDEWAEALSKITTPSEDENAQ